MGRKRKLYGGSLGTGIFILIYGLYYTIIPHVWHQVSALDWLIFGFFFGAEGFPHEIHVFALGIPLLLAGIILILRGTGRLN